MSVSVHEGTKKTLLLVIPENGSTEADCYISEMTECAEECGIVLKVVKYEKSNRYAEPSESAASEED